MSIKITDAAGKSIKVAGQGLPGPPGLDGKSAYQYAVEGGFTGTEDEFKALMGVRSNPNLLDNWYFVDPINQKGQAEYTAGVYTIDRWRVSADSLRVENDGIVVENGDSENAGIWQPIDAKRLIPGRTYTISVLVAELDGTAKLTFWGKAYVDIEAGITSYTFIHTGEEAETTAYPIVHLHGSIKAIAAKLELGSVQTLAHKEGDAWVLNDPPPDKALELLKCQRYFVRVYYDQYDTIGISSSNSERIGLIMPLPTNMRLKQPSVSVTCHPKRISDNLEMPVPSGCTVSGAVATVQFYHSGSTIAAYVFAAQQGYIEFDANL